MGHVEPEPQTSVNFTFDFYDDHCSYDLEDLHARLSETDKERLVALYPDALTEWNHAELVRDATTKLNAAGHGHLADILSAGLHADGSCECAMFDYEFYASCAQDELCDITASYPEAAWVLMRGDELGNVTEELNFAELLDTVRGNRHDGWVRLSVSLDHTGTGTVNLDGSVLEIIGVTDPAHADLLRRANNGDFYDPETGDTEGPARQVLTLSGADVALLSALLEADPVIRTAADLGEQWDQRFTDLTLDQIRDAVTPFNDLPAGHKHAAAALVGNWDGSLAELAETVKVAHTPVLL